LRHYPGDPAGILLSVPAWSFNRIIHFDNMENAKSFNLSEAVLSAIAIVLTLADIFYRGSVFLLKKTISLFFQLLCILMVASVILLAYLILMTIATMTGPWFNTNFQ
jgi:uncharacterized Tic20 family protein